jgi:hypothetical protein
MNENMEENAVESAPRNMNWKGNDLYLGEVRVGGINVYERDGRFNTSVSLPGNPTFGSLVGNEDDAKKQVEEEVKGWLEKAGLEAK